MKTLVKMIDVVKTSNDTYLYIIDDIARIECVDVGVEYYIISRLRTLYYTYAIILNTICYIKHTIIYYDSIINAAGFLFYINFCEIQIN